MSDNFTYKLVIRCTQAELWAAITQPEQMSKHIFACEKVVGNPTVGNDLELIRKDGSLLCRQTILAIDAPNRIEAEFQPYVFGKPLPSSTLVHSIRNEGDTCLLIVEQQGISGLTEELEEAAMRFSSSVKSRLETGEPIRMDA